jgi:hypothetical protein
MENKIGEVDSEFEKFEKGLVDYIKKSLGSIEKLAKKSGMTQRSIDLLFEGEEVRFCPKCVTQNLIYFKSDEEGNHFYRCNKCSKFYVEDKDGNEVTSKFY